jgi:hypothetical protein
MFLTLQDIAAQKDYASQSCARAVTVQLIFVAAKELAPLAVLSCDRYSRW